MNITTQDSGYKPRGTSSRRKEIIKQSADARVVAAFPIDLSATGTAAEHFVVAPREGRKAMRDPCLRCA